LCALVLVSALVFVAALIVALTPLYSQTPLPEWADSWHGIHSILVTEPVGNFTDAYIQSIASRFDFGLSSTRYRAFKAGNPGFINSIHLGALQSMGRDVAWFRANRPDWLLYNCDRTTPLVIDNHGGVVADFTNPDYVNFKWNTEFVPGMRPARFPFQAIVLDGAFLENQFYTPSTGVTWSHACGAYDAQGQWVQKFAGIGSHADVPDPAFTDAVITYLAEIRRRLHAASPPLLLITNTYPRIVYNDPIRRARFITAVDGVMIQDGDYGPHSVGDYRQMWLNHIRFVEDMNAAGKAVYVEQREPGVIAETNRSQAFTRFVLASYLLAKGHASGIRLRTASGTAVHTVDDGISWPPEFEAANQIGVPCGPMSQVAGVDATEDGLFMREHSGGVSLVNASRTAAYVATLPGGFYTDLYGEPANSPLTVQPLEGVVLLRTGPPACSDSNSFDTTPPVISSISLTNITADSANINWITDEAADSQVEFLAPCPAAGCLSPLMSGLTTSHTISVLNLEPGTVYTYRVRSKDAAGNLAVASNENLMTGIPDTMRVTIAALDPPISGLVGQWMFDDGSGTTAADASGHNYNGTLVNNPVWTTGKFGGALEFNRTNRVTVPDNDAFSFGNGSTDQPFSVAMWVSFDDANPGHLIGHFLPPSNREWRFARLDSSSLFLILFDENTKGQIARSVSQNFSTGVWYHLTATYDGSRNGNGVTFYINGMAQAQTGNSDTAGYVAMKNAAAPLEMAGYSGTGSNFAGRLDDVRLYSRVLSASEVMDVYNGGTSQQPPVISSVSATSVTASGATITWTTDKPADSQVDYGLTTAYGSSTTLDPALVLSHSQALSSLIPNALYHYRVRSKDGAGNIATSGDFTFTTTGAPPVNGLIGQWMFDDGSGTTAADTSGHNYNGTLVNNPVWTTGKFGGALQFNGTNRVTVPDNDTFSFGNGSTDQPFSIAMWVHFDNTSPGNLIGHFLAPLNREWRFGRLDSSSLFLILFDENTKGQIARSVSQSFSTGVWYHLAVTYDGSRSGNGVQFYIDGVARAQGGNSDTPGYAAMRNTPAPLEIAGLNGGGSFAGKLDDVRLYNRALLPSEVMDVYNGGTSQQPPVISSVSATNITTSSATITWTTDKPADGQVDYGLTTAYGSSTTLDPSLVLNHSQTLSNLTPSTLYHYRVRSRDASGNSATSDDFTFTTTAVPPASGLIGQWMFDDGGGTTAADSSGHNYNGTLINNPVWTAGKTGGALQFNGTNRVAVPDNDAFSFGSGSTDQPFSIAMWVHFDNASPGNLIGHFLAPLNREWRFARLDSSSLFLILFDESTKGQIARSVSQSFSTGVWYHLAVTYDGSRSGNGVQFYIDGVARAQSGNSDTPGYVTMRNAPAPLEIAGVNGGGSFAGKLDDVRLYSRALLPSEVMDVYNGGTSQQPPVISSVSATNITTSSATITWTTDKLADSLVEYGTTTAYGSSTTLDPSLVLSHSQTLSNLTPNTLYHYRVRSKDGAGNIGTSGDFTFMTGGAPPVVGLVGQWKFDDGSGSTAVDSSGHNYNGTLVNNPMWTAGKLGGALQFNGTNRVTVPDNDAFSFGNGSTDQPFSLAIWVYFDNASPGNLIGHFLAPLNREWRFARLDSSSLFLILFDENAKGQIARSVSQSFSTGVWYHLAVTYDGSRSGNGVQFYIDGVARAQSGNSDTPGYVAMRNMATPLEIAGATGGGSFAGKLDDIRLYNRVLTHSEIQGIYNEAGTTFFVAPNGNDNNPGTIEAPFRTIPGAQAAVRSINSTMHSNITVYLRQGTYAIPGALAFDARDSGNNGYNVIYASYPGEHATITGGQNITGWTAVGNGIYRANAPGLNFRQLYVNGVPAIRARTPNVDDVQPYHELVDWTNEGQIGNRLDNGDPIYRTYPIVRSQDIAQWNNLTDVEFVSDLEWTHLVFHISSFLDVGGGNTKIIPEADETANLFAGHYGHKKADNGSLPNPYYYFENAYEFLDTPGEWYLNRQDGALFYIPRAGENLATAVVPLVEGLLQIQGGSPNSLVQNLQFHELTFEYSNWTAPSSNGFFNSYADTRQLTTLQGSPELEPIPAAVYIRDAKNLRFERNVFRRLGGTGVLVYSGVSDSNFIGNVFQDIAGSGIALEARYSEPGFIPNYFREPLMHLDPETIVRNNVIRNNYFNRVAQGYPGSLGIFATYVQGLVIEHNEFADMPYSGISVGSAGWRYFATETNVSDNLVQYNKVRNVMKRLADGGGIYVMNSQPRSKILENYIDGLSKSQWAGGNYVIGVYLDADTMNFTVLDNVIENLSTSSDHLHYFLNSGSTSNVLRINLTDSYVNWGTNNQIDRVDSINADAIKAASGIEEAYRNIVIP
jgi:hypothetical protein